MEFRIELMDDEYAELARLACSRVTPAGIAKRAKAVLAVAQGNSMSGAGREVEMTLKHVRKWCKRVHAAPPGKRIDALKDKPGRGRKPRFSP